MPPRKIWSQTEKLKQIEGAVCLGVSYDTAKHLTNYDGRPQTQEGLEAKCRTTDGTSSDDCMYYSSDAKIYDLNENIRKACPTLDLSYEEQMDPTSQNYRGNFTAKTKTPSQALIDAGTPIPDLGPPTALCKAALETYWDSGTVNSVERAVEASRDAPLQYREYGATDDAGDPVGEELKECSCKFAGDWYGNACDDGRSIVESVPCRISDVPSGRLLKGLMIKDYVNTARLWAEGDGSPITSDMTIGGPTALQKGCPREGVGARTPAMYDTDAPPDYQPRRYNQTLPGEPQIITDSFETAKYGILSAIGFTAEAARAAGSGMGPRVPGSDDNTEPDMTIPETEYGPPNRGWVCGRRLEEGDADPCDEPSDPENVLKELRNLGACQAVLPLNTAIAGALCNNSETQCMADIDNYFATTDIDEILAAGTGSADIINNNCKTYYLDYDFGERTCSSGEGQCGGSSREEKIELLKKAAKSYCKSPGSGSSFVNNGLCLPQCKPLLEGSDATCSSNNAFVGVGYKTIDNPYTAATDDQRIAFTNCCVDNTDTPGTDDNNCARVDEQLRSNAYIALSGNSGGYTGYLEQTIAADSSLRRALQETPDDSDYSSDSSHEFTGGGHSGSGSGGGRGGGTQGADRGFGNWMGLNGSAQLNQTISCLNSLFDFMRTYVVPAINDNANLRGMPNLAMLINPGYGILPDALPGANIEAFTGLTDFATTVIAGLGGETANWQRIASYARMATALRNFLLTQIDRAGVYLERLSTIQESLTGLAGGVAGARRYDSQIFMDLMDAVIDRYRQTNAPGMDPTTYTPIVPWAALFGTGSNWVG